MYSGQLNINKNPVDENTLLNIQTETQTVFEQWLQQNINKVKEVPLDSNGQVTPLKTSENLNNVETTPLKQSTAIDELGVTPLKRAKIMEEFKLKTPSPLLKKPYIKEELMMGVSASVHLWADRKPGGIKYLLLNKLTEEDFEDIINFAGPNSSLNILKDLTNSQLRSLWRNTSRNSKSYRGHNITGYENDLQLHENSKIYCPFGHCRVGIMRPLDFDMIQLTTPEQKQLPVAQKNFDLEFSPVSSFTQHNLSSRSSNKGTIRELFTLEEDFSTENETSVKSQDRVCYKSDARKERITDIDSEVTLKTHFAKDSTQMTESRMSLVNTGEMNEGRYIAVNILNDLVSSLPSVLANISVIKPDQSKVKNRPEFKMEGTLSSLGQPFEVSGGSSYTSGNYEKVISSNISCTVDGCNKVFVTVNGYERHVAVHHENEKVVKLTKRDCDICGKSVKLLDRHIREQHREKVMKCDVCLEVVKSNFLQHRRECIKCRFCPYVNKKKHRLLEHMKEEHKLDYSAAEYNELANIPLNLQSPAKKKNLTQNLAQMSRNTEFHSPQSLKATLPNFSSKLRSGTSGKNSDNRPGSMMEGIPSSMGHCVNDSNEEGRSKFSIDEGEDEGYTSEWDWKDSADFTKKRRNTKDDLELRLRHVDSLTNDLVEGDHFIVEEFRKFMMTRRASNLNDEGGFSREDLVSTLRMYPASIKNDLLPALHEEIMDFDARMLLDCVNPKNVKINGEERAHVNPEEPIYITSHVIENVLKKFEDSGHYGSKKKTFLAATNRLMEFIEYSFNQKMVVYGIEPLNRVMAYHQSVRGYIRAASKWKSAKDEEKIVHSRNLLIKEYENPNDSAKIYEKFQQYLNSQDRMQNIAEINKFSSLDANLPTDSEWLDMNIFGMQEIVTVCGVRPIVVRHLPLYGYIDRRPGFNPLEVEEGEEKVVQEEVDGDKIYRFKYSLVSIIYKTGVELKIELVQ